MARRKRPSRPRPQPPLLPSYFLDRFSTEDVLKAKGLWQRMLEFHWKYYTEFAFQRWQVKEKLRAALLEAAVPKYTFSRWQRVVRYKRALFPLSAAGSLSDPGGRFNIGAIDAERFPTFPALYIGQDKETVLQELLAQGAEATGKLNRLELALVREDSIVCVSVSGSLAEVIDLTQPERLTGFVEEVRQFSISPELVDMAKDLKLPEPGLVRGLEPLMNELLYPDWREYPMQVDVPANSQILGQLVEAAGIEGIVYASKFSDKDCLAVFPRNFEDSESYVQLDDPAPKTSVIARLDATTWSKLV